MIQEMACSFLKVGHCVSLPAKERTPEGKGNKIQLKKEFHETEEYITEFSKEIKDHRLKGQLVENTNTEKIQEKMALATKKKLACLHSVSLH